MFRPGSIYRKGYKDTSRDRALATMNNVLWHLHPTKVKRHGLKLTYTFCRRAVVLPVRAADPDRDLPDVLLPPDGRHRRRHRVHGHAIHPHVRVLRRPRPKPA